MQQFDIGKDCDRTTTLTLTGATFGYCPIKTLYLGGNISPSGHKIICDDIFQYIVPSPFSGKPLETIIFGNNVTSISDYAFSNCNSLKTLVVAGSVTTVGEHAFADCSSLTWLVISSPVKTIGNYAFANCRNLKSVDIADSVTAIGDFAFNDCVNLRTVSLGKNLKTIGDRAFFLDIIFYNYLECWKYFVSLSAHTDRLRLSVLTCQY